MATSFFLLRYDRESKFSAIVLYLTFLAEPPSPPVITGLPQNETVREGQTLVLSCSSASGSPKPRLRWFVGDSLDEIANALVNTSDTPHARSTLTLVVSREDNDREYRYEL